MDRWRLAVSKNLTDLMVKLIKQNGILLKAMFPKNTDHTLLNCSNLSIILSILLFTFIRPPHHLSDFARGVRDRAYPPLRLQTNTLKRYYCRSSFHCLWPHRNPLVSIEGYKAGAIIITKFKYLYRLHIGSQAQ